MQTKKTKRPKGLIRRFIPYFAKYKAVLFFDLFCAALTTVCELVLPMLVRYVTNAGINDLASLTVGVVLKIGALNTRSSVWTPRPTSSWPPWATSWARK